jgi:hypothetical protein
MRAADHPCPIIYPRPRTRYGISPNFRRTVPLWFPIVHKGLAVSSQAIVYIGGANRDRTGDLYNAIVFQACFREFTHVDIRLPE